MAPTGRGSSWRCRDGQSCWSRSGAAHWLASHGGQAACPSLTAVVGPRQGTWTRSFNPFRSDAESRWPTWAGIYEPLLISNRATGPLHALAGLGLLLSADNLDLPRHDAGGVRWSDGQPFSARATSPSPSTSCGATPPRPRRGLAVRARDRASDAQTVEFKLAIAVHAGRRLPRRAGHRARAQVEGRRPACDLRRPACRPWATGPFVTVPQVRAHGVRAGSQSLLLADGQAWRGRAPRTAVPEQRRSS